MNLAHLVIWSLPLISSLKCWEGSTTRSELSLGPPFSGGMHEVNCSGACHLLADRCDVDNNKSSNIRSSNNKVKISVARCVDTCPFPGVSDCEICCHSDMCNSETSLSGLVFDSPLTIFSLPTNAIQFGIRGKSSAYDLCATLVLIQPPKEGCVSDISAYITVNKGVESCTWRDPGNNAQLLSVAGCWTDLQANSAQMSIVARVSSDIFSGKIIFNTSSISFSSSSSTVVDSDGSTLLPLSGSSASASFASSAEPKSYAQTKATKSEPSAAERFTVTTTGRTDSAAKVSLNNKTLVVQISSPFGIGSASIFRNKAQWPKNIAVVLDVKGLESLQISNGNITLHASVSSRSIRLWKYDETDVIMPGSSDFTSILVVNEAGDEIPSPYRLPLADGLRFRVIVPHSLFTLNVSMIQLQWIDFYR